MTAEKTGDAVSATILVGVDGSPRAADALALAAALAAPLDATIRVANVRPVIPQPWLPGSDALKQDLGEESGAVLERARDTLGDPAGATYHSVVETSVPRALQQLAEQHEPAVIVVAQTHKGRVRRVAGVAEHLLHGAPGPVAVAPPGLADHDAKIERVAVGFDGSPESANALRQAVAIAERCGASLRVVGVFDTMTIAWAGPPVDRINRDLADRMIADLETEIEAAVDRYGAGTGVQVAVVEGGPSTTLLDVSGEVDLLVCGSRGLGPIGATVIGSVSNRLVHTAKCPVLDVPKGSTPIVGDRPEATAKSAA